MDEMKIMTEHAALLKFANEMRVLTNLPDTASLLDIHHAIQQALLDPTRLGMMISSIIERVNKLEMDERGNVDTAELGDEYVRVLLARLAELLSQSENYSELTCHLVTKGGQIPFYIDVIKSEHAGPHELRKVAEAKARAMQVRCQEVKAILASSKSIEPALRDQLVEKLDIGVDSDHTFDMTDAAEPAYWRGQDDGVRGTILRIRQALAGVPRGAFASAELNELYDVISRLPR